MGAEIWSNSTEPYWSIWLRLPAARTGLDRDLLVGALYLPPHPEDEAVTWLALAAQVERAQEEGCYVLLMGDLNARLGTLPDQRLEDPERVGGRAAA